MVGLTCIHHIGSNSKKVYLFTTGQINKIQLSMQFLFIFYMFLLDVNEKYTMTSWTMFIHIWGCKIGLLLKSVKNTRFLTDINITIINLDLPNLSKKDNSNSSEINLIHKPNSNNTWRIKLNCNRYMFLTFQLSQLENWW